jgi:hypothetical protein
MDISLQKKLASYADVNDFVFIETGKSIPADTIRHLIARLPGFKIAIGIPSEEDRVQSDPQEIDTYFELLESILIGFPADMVVNLDETGHYDSVNA